MNLCGRGDKDVFTIAQGHGGRAVSGRIDARFARAARARAAPGWSPSSPQATPISRPRAALLAGLPAAGADLIEIGMPFTDPMADGPAIQAASLRALAAGARMTTHARAGAPAPGRAIATTPIVLMGYYNPIYAYGNERFLADAKAAGADGLIVVDLPPEEDAELCLPARAAGLDFIRLATPTTDDRRLPAVLENISGFIYYVSVTGITGQKAAVAERVAPEVARIKRHTRLPVAVGFGIREPEQAAEIARIADAAVVGSALVDLLAGNLDARRPGHAGPGAGACTPRSRALADGGPGRRAMSWLTNYVRPKIRALYTREQAGGAGESLAAVRRPASG